MVATRSLKPFELVLEDDYLSCGPSEFNPSSCVICLKRVKDASSVCPQCNVPVCQLEECQAGLATIHEPECLVFRQHQPEKLKVELDSKMPSPVYSLVVPLRLLSLREKDPTRWKLTLTLTSHLEESPNPNDKCQYIWSTGMPILERCGMDQADRVLMAHLMGILWTNAVTMPRLRENLGDPLGHTLFPNFSIFAHDCMANCRYTVSKDGRSVTVRALRHIKEGENLNITYTNPLLGNQTRRKAFFSHWQFNCGCQRCSSATEMDTYLSAVRCPDKDGYLLPTEPLERGSAWKCDRCGKLEASERVEKTMKEIKELGENINILAPLDTWNGYLNGKLAEELHPNHWVAMNVKLVVIQLLSTRDLLDTLDKINRALELCDNYLEVYGKVCPGYAKWRGHIVELKSKATLKLAEHNAKEEGQQMDSGLIIKSLLMMKEATKCRQYEPEEDMAMLGFLLRDHNEALDTL